MFLYCGAGEDGREFPWLQDQLVSFKGNPSWVFMGRTDAEAEVPILWPPNVKSWLIWNDPDAGKDWRPEEKGTTEDEVVGWHHQLDGYEFGWIPRVGDGQGGLACCGSWGCKELDTTERLNWTELNWMCTYCHLRRKMPVQKTWNYRLHLYSTAEERDAVLLNQLTPRVITVCRSQENSR